ncbi:MAG: DUF739 family protein, partial [Clostridia bacterium]|nr:DUF739 family protein [Clostridia bacterium]
DYSLLIGLIKRVFGSQKDFAKAMGWSETALSLKLNNIQNWKQDSITKASNLLGIPHVEIGIYFFNVEVQ